MLDPSPPLKGPQTSSEQTTAIPEQPKHRSGKGTPCLSRCLASENVSLYSLPRPHAATSLLRPTSSRKSPMFHPPTSGLPRSALQRPPPQHVPGEVPANTQLPLRHPRMDLVPSVLPLEPLPPGNSAPGHTPHFSPERLLSTGGPSRPHLPRRLVLLLSGLKPKVPAFKQQASTTIRRCSPASQAPNCPGSPRWPVRPSSM